MKGASVVPVVGGSGQALRLPTHIVGSGTPTTPLLLDLLSFFGTSTLNEFIS